MSKDDPPPKNSFSASAGYAAPRRMSPFTLNQLAALQLFWAEMINSKNIGCTMEFDSGHNHMRVTYRLTNPRSEDKDLTVALIEFREHDGTYKYTLECKVDGKLHHQEDIMSNIKTREEIPAYAIQHLRKKIPEMNSHDFSSPMPLEINRSVTSLADWKARLK